MAESTLLGWNTETWGRVLEWAGEDRFPVFTGKDVKRLAGVRKKWLKAGGPLSGPVSGLVLTDGQ